MIPTVITTTTTTTATASTSLPTSNTPIEASSSSWYTRPLIVTKFSKETRPYAWKNVDTKIQDILPMLGNDKIARNALKMKDNNNHDNNNRTLDDMMNHHDGISSTSNHYHHNNPVFLVKVTIQLIK